MPARQRGLGAVAQTGQRRLQVVGDVVGNLLQPLVELGDAGEHRVEVCRQAVELVAGAGHRQPAGEVAAHDAAARLSDAVDALQRRASDEVPDQKRAERHDAEGNDHGAPHHGAETLRFAQVAADEQDHLVGQPQDERGGRMAVVVYGCLAGRAVAAGGVLAVALVEERALRPAIRLENAGLEAFDIAGKHAAVRIGEQVEVGARLARADLDDAHEQRQPAALIGAGETLRLLLDRGLRLGGEHAHRQRGHVEDEDRRAGDEQDQVQRGKARRRGPHQGRQGRHQPALSM